MTYLTTTLTDQKTNLSFQKTTVTASQDVTTSFTLVEGGQISYTPSSSDAEVMVEFTTAYGRKDPDNSLMLRLQIGDTVGTLGDVVVNNIDYHNDFGTTTTTNNTNFSDIITLKYKLSGWTGSKVLQVQCKTYNSSASLESIVNATRRISTSDILLFNPIMVVYEV
tara:strand:+ start:359 stop:856 length:498 start_codon:yes stop_codon:yes gene_type:complete